MKPEPEGNKYRVWDAKNNDRLGVVYAWNSLQAMDKARARWPEKYPYLNISLLATAEERRTGP